MNNERRKNHRIKFGYYLRVTDDNTHEIVGYLSDISPQGFRLECPRAVVIGQKYTLRLELTSQLADQPFITLDALAIWNQPDPVTPYEFIGGFRIVGISPPDKEIYDRILEKYGTPENG